MSVWEDFWDSRQKEQLDKYLGWTWISVIILSIGANIVGFYVSGVVFVIALFTTGFLSAFLFGENEAGFKPFSFETYAIFWVTVIVVVVWAFFQSKESQIVLLVWGFPIIVCIITIFFFLIGGSVGIIILDYWCRISKKM